MALDLIAELQAILEVLEDAGVEYALCGGIAVAVHGHPRATKDIDLLVAANDADTVLTLVKPLGFDVPSRKMVFRAGKPDENHMQRVSKLDPDGSGRLLSLDLLIVGTVHQEAWNTRTRMQLPWRSGGLTVVSRQGLAIMKKHSGRPQDLADIAALEGTDDENA